MLCIGETAFVGRPGEPICEAGLDTQKQVAAAGFKNVLTFGLVNDYLGYIVSEQEYPHGGDEVDERSYHGPGLGSLFASKAGEGARKLWVGPIIGISARCMPEEFRRVEVLYSGQNWAAGD